MLIRKMIISDFEAVFNLWNAAGLNLPDITECKIETTKIISLNPFTNFVLEDKGKIIGSVLGLFNGRRGWIYHLAVHPEFQKKGLGSLLLRKVELELRNVGAPRVLLWVEKDNLKFVPFYRKKGYLPVDDAIVLGKNL